MYEREQIKLQKMRKKKKQNETNPGVNLVSPKKRGFSSVEGITVWPGNGLFVRGTSIANVCLTIICDE